MTDHFDDCLHCGQPFDTAVRGPTTLQVDSGQVCIYNTSDGVWAFIHRVGGGKRD